MIFFDVYKLDFDIFNVFARVTRPSRFQNQTPLWQTAQADPPIRPTAPTAVVQTGWGEISGHILSLNLLLYANEIYVSKLKICNLVTQEW